MFCLKSAAYLRPVWYTLSRLHRHAQAGRGLRTFDERLRAAPVSTRTQKSGAAPDAPTPRVGSWTDTRPPGAAAHATTVGPAAGERPYRRAMLCPCWVAACTVCRA